MGRITKSGELIATVYAARLGVAKALGAAAPAGSPLPFCAARICYQEKGVDYCFQCDEYPCRRNGYPENLDRRWPEKIDRMREVGVEQFYRESLETPRY